MEKVLIKDVETRFLTEHLKSLLINNGLHSLQDVASLNYKELTKIQGVGKLTSFKICLRMLREYPEIFHNSNLAKSIEILDETKFSKFSWVYNVVHEYKNYTQALVEQEREI